MECGGEAGGERGGVGRGQVTSGFVGHGKELGFYPKSDRTPLKGNVGPCVIGVILE